MQKITGIKIKRNDNTYSEKIPISVSVENVEWDDKYTLKEVLGNVDIDNTENVQNQINELSQKNAVRVESLNEVPLVDTVIETVGNPVYIDDSWDEYDAFGINEAGWYVFARITAKKDIKVSEQTTIEGAAGYIKNIGAEYLDLAVRFDVAATSQIVKIKWNNNQIESFVFKSTDLAIRNLDYRVTFYLYDIDRYATWEYDLTTDSVFTADKRYYIKNDDDTYTYVPITEYTIGDPIPENTYYKHSKVTFKDMIRNVCYNCSTPIDCPVVFQLPQIEEDGHGAWFEIRFYHLGSYSSTLVPPSGDVKIASQHTQPETKGINAVDLFYTSVAGQKVWRFLNTHSNFTASTPTLESIAFRKGPDKTQYQATEEFDMTGAVVVATFSDGSTQIVTATYDTDDPIIYPVEIGSDRQRYDVTASYTSGDVTKTATTDLYIMINE